MVLIGRALDEIAWSICFPPGGPVCKTVERDVDCLPPQPPSHLISEADVGDALPAAHFFAQHSTGAEPEHCEACGGRFPVAKPPEWVKDMSNRYLCAACCLLEDAHANPFQFLKHNLEQVWMMQARLFAAQSPGVLTPPQGPIAAPGSNVVLVFWDSSDDQCQMMCNALWHGFSDVCCLVDIQNRVAADAGCRAHPRIPRDDLCCPGGISAVFPSGSYAVGCERHPKILLYELKYCHRVQTPPVDVVRRLEYECLRPLHELQAAFEARPVVGYEYWWLTPDALITIAQTLAREHFVVLDGFLTADECKRCGDAAKRLYSCGHMEPGRKTGGSELHDDGSDLMNRDGKDLRWTMLDDNIAYCGDGDNRAFAVRHRTKATDLLVSALKVGGPGHPPIVASRLRHVDLREKCMVTCYREASRGRYQQHVDSHDAKYRVLSTLLYTNEDWQPEYGGSNRMYGPGLHSTSVRYDTLPIDNRMLVFWAGDECPHEVLPAFRDRYAMTVWYAGADVLVEDMLGHPNGMRQMLEQDHMKIVGHLQTAFPVCPLTFKDAMMNAGVPEDEASRLHDVHSFMAYDRRPPHWQSWDEAKAALLGQDQRFQQLLH